MSDEDLSEFGQNGENEMSDTVTAAEVEAIRELISNARRIEAHRDELAGANENQRLFIKALQERIAILEADRDVFQTQLCTAHFVRRERDRLHVERDNMEREMLQLKADTTDEINRLQASLSDSRLNRNNQVRTIEILSSRCDELAAYKTKADNMIAKLRVTLSSLPDAPKP